MVLFLGDGMVMGGSEFLILGYPRSGTAWLSSVLTFGRMYCYHELLFRCSYDMNEYSSMLKNHDVCGNSDSGGLLFYEKILENNPSTKIIVIERDKKEVIDSFIRFSKINESKCVETINEFEVHLKTAKKVSHFYSKYCDVCKYDIINSIWKMLMQEEIPMYHWQKMKSVKITMKEEELNI